MTSIRQPTPRGLRQFDMLMDGKPFFYCDVQNGVVSMTHYGLPVTACNPDDEILYFKTEAFKRHEERLRNPQPPTAGFGE